MFYRNGRRQLTLRDMPLVCMILAAVFALWPYFSPPLEEVVGKGELQSLVGSVDRIYQTAPYQVYHSGRHGGHYTYFPGYVHVVVAVNGAPDDDVAQDAGILAYAPGLLELKKGDDVTLLEVRRLPAVSRLWELSRGTTTVLAYEDTRNYVARVYGHPTFWERLAALGLFVVAIVLRRRLGTWTQPDDGLDAIAQSTLLSDRTHEQALDLRSNDRNPPRSAPAPMWSRDSEEVAKPGVQRAVDKPHDERADVPGILLTPESAQWSIDTSPSPHDAAIAPAAPAQHLDDVAEAPDSATIPPELAAAAHKSDQAIAVLLALLLDANPDVRGHQQAHVREFLGEPTLAMANTFAPQVARLHPRLRLPLAALAFPALHRRPRAELTALIACVDAMVQADGKVGLFESCLGCMLHRQLTKALDPSANWRAGRSKVLDVLDEVALLLSLLAQYGDASAAVAEHAYSAGMHSIVPDAKIPYAPPAEGFAALDKAWATLDALDSIGKTLLIEGMVATIGTDGKMTVAQSDLLRTVCAVLECPLPPLLGHV